MSAPSFPLAAPPFDGESRAVAAGNGFEWLKDGWALFVASPAQWLALTLVFLLVVFGLYVVPWIGAPASNLMTPMLAAGMLVAARKVANGTHPQIGDLFIAFRHCTGPLAMLGVLYMGAMLAILLVVVVIGGGSVAGGLMLGRSAGLGLALGGVLLSLMLSLVLSVPLLMAIWFAPALVVFNNMDALPALKASFNACLRNGLPFVVYSLFLLVLSFFALLPVGLGFFVLIPVAFGSLYASYRDVFVAD